MKSWDKIDYIACLLASYVHAGDTVATGVASLLPMLAILLAQKTHATGAHYLNCIGAVDPELNKIGSSSEDVLALGNKKAFMQLGDLFDLGKKGKIDTMFFSAAQIDQKANINLTCIGNFQNPKVKLAGPAGSSLMLKKVKRPVLFTMKHNSRVFVEKVDFITAAGLRTHESIDLVTNIAVIRLSEKSAELVHIHPWSNEQEVREETGYDLRINLFDTFKPDQKSLDILRTLDKENKRHALFIE